ncbi:uncharacterized protein LOC113874559 [Abrus precatorius]|uniref:tRNA-uridine aminocarboxypropyltransferase n=1 Tax=Abrus precatorius TaxID=3816 RepID=A0A8B8MJ19_ABRPR|nr:uncharacterized protein LOC113874559 [Abrus precatorius]
MDLNSMKSVIRNSIICADKNIVNEFKSQMNDLISNRNFGMREAEEARMKGGTLNSNALSWLQAVEKLIEEGKEMQSKRRGCFVGKNLYRRYEEMVKRMGDLNNTTISFIFTPIPEMQYFSTTNLKYYESTKVASHQLVRALRNGSNYIIGLYGKRGSGKTKLVKAEGEKATYLKLVDEVAFATVSQNPSIRRIQDEIADCISLKLEENSDAGRARTICKRLQSGEKILVILDDVREKLELEDIGIPHVGNRGKCKILLTSRKQQVLILMECQREIPLDPLSQEEAWELFKKHSGIDEENEDETSSESNLLKLAREVAAECEGLPGKIKEVGSSLKRKPIEEWEASLDSMRYSSAQYQIFLSFRGEDTRYSFAGFLYHTLCREGFKTFMDEGGLESGDHISESLIKAIETSRLSIIVLSENYAESSWCLDELVAILECKKTKNQLVWPIFYKVEPSDVRFQKNSYGKAMDAHAITYENNSERVQKWKSALFEVAGFSGYHYKTGYEHEFIQKIVDKANDIKNRLCYQVFLSFRGEDTRYSFTGFLHHGLCREGFKIFMDDGGLERGDQISESLIRAIEASRLAIIVLSENYAFSSWCLDELVTILECKKTKNQLVWPIFYKVDPSDVRYQKNSYGKAMNAHAKKFGDDSERVQKWRLALSEVAGLSGDHYTTGYEHEFIQMIVDKGFFFYTHGFSWDPDPKHHLVQHKHKLLHRGALKISMSVMQGKFKRPICPSCSKPTRTCLCSRILTSGIQNSVNVTILQHALEHKHPLNSTRIATLGLKNVNVATVSDVNFDARFLIRLLDPNSQYLQNGLLSHQSWEIEETQKLFSEKGSNLIDCAGKCGLENDIGDVLNEIHAEVVNHVSNNDGAVVNDEVEKIPIRPSCNLTRGVHEESGEPAITVSIGKYGAISSLSHIWMPQCQSPKLSFDKILAYPEACEALSKGFLVKKLQRKQLNEDKDLEEYEEFELEVRPGSVLLFPSDKAIKISELDAIGFEVKNLIVLDGTWAKAKRIYSENPWLNILPHVKLEVNEKSLYSEVRHQPKAGYLSTIESIVFALKAVGENHEGLDGLLDTFESMVGDQRRCKEERLNKLFSS